MKPKADVQNNHSRITGISFSLLLLGQHRGQHCKTDWENKIDLS